jgi:hypothetical protein
MTIETRSTIELSDVIACEFVCNKCKTKTVRLLNADFNLPGTCGNCKNIWLTEGQESNDLRIFLNLLQRYAAGVRPFTLRLEIKHLAVGIINSSASREGV